MMPRCPSSPPPQLSVATLAVVIVLSLVAGLASAQAPATHDTTSSSSSDSSSRGWPRPTREVSAQGFELVKAAVTAAAANETCGGDGDAACVPDVCGAAEFMLHGRLEAGATQVRVREPTERRPGSPAPPLVF